MSAPMGVYRELEGRLVHLRWIHGGRECIEEQDLVEAMAAAWYQLSEDEQAQIRSESPKTLLQDDSE